ncbi:hypothetical protein D3C72_1631280 [compost metagenome]
MAAAGAGFGMAETWIMSAIWLLAVAICMATGSERRSANMGSGTAAGGTSKVRLTLALATSCSVLRLLDACGTALSRRAAICASRLRAVLPPSTTPTTRRPL